MNAANLALRFFLELVALAGIAVGAWQATSGLWRIALSAVVVVLAMAAWGIFAVPGDPSRSGSAPVPVTGMVRLALELLIMAAGAYGLHAGGYTYPAVGFAVLVVIHYALSGDRISWLLGH